jgi:ureidoacrylate peracid hydrolase
MHEGLGVGQSHTAPDGRPGRILVRDTWNTDIITALQPQDGDLVLYKTRYSGFYRTDLHERLAAAGTRQLIVIGCTTSVCVESTVRDAMFRDYEPVVLSDCVNEVVGADRAYSNHRATLDLIEARLGWVSSADALVRSLNT